MATNPKKKIIDTVTQIDSTFLQPIFGGDPGADPSSPEFNGHLHDGRTDSWGHVSKIDLSSHVTNYLILADGYAVSKKISDTGSVITPQAGIRQSNVWYFSLPTDLDMTKPAYFSFLWMGQTLNNSNVAIQPTVAKTTVFQVTWQWYVPGYSVFAPSLIYDGAAPANQPNVGLNGNSLTRGRVPSLVVNSLPYQMYVNDSAAVPNTPNYINLTGLQSATGTAMIGVQVDVVSTGFYDAGLIPLGGINFFQGVLTYISRSLGSQTTSFRTL